MKFVAAYLMATMGGNASPTKDDVRAILHSVGAEVDEDKLDLLFDRIAGRDVAELVAAGREKFAFAAPSCGVAPGAAAAGGAAAEEAKEEKKKVEEKEEEEDDDVDGMFGLFD